MLRYLETTRDGHLLTPRQTAYQHKGLWFQVDETSGAGHDGHLRRILSCYLDYYHRSRTHLSLGKDSPEPRSAQPLGPGKIVAFPQVGGLHHRYERLAA